MTEPDGEPTVARPTDIDHGGYVISYSLCSGPPSWARPRKAIRSVLSSLGRVRYRNDDPSQVELLVEDSSSITIFEIDASLPNEALTALLELDMVDDTIRGNRHGWDYRTSTWVAVSGLGQEGHTVERAERDDGSGEVADGMHATFRQRFLGLRLRQLRVECSLTVKDVSDMTQLPPNKISRIETGTMLNMRHVHKLCEIYRAGYAETEELIELARHSNEPGWLIQHDDLRAGPHIFLEGMANSITCYTMSYVPILLQTDDYARALIEAITPKIHAQIVDERVEFMRRRQTIMQENGPRYRAIIDESVLHRRVGGDAVMTAQLDWILTLEREAGAIVQVIPFSIGAHSAVDSNFTLFEFDSWAPPVLFVEGYIYNLCQEQEMQLRRYSDAIDNLRDTALNPRDSIQRIKSLKESYEPGG